MSDYTCITEKASAEDPGPANVIVTPPPFLQRQNTRLPEGDLRDLMETFPRPCSDVLPRPLWWFK